MEKERSLDKEKWRFDLDSDKTKCELFEITNFPRACDCFCCRKLQCRSLFQCFKSDFLTDTKQRPITAPDIRNSYKSDLVCRSVDGDLDEFASLQQSTEVWRVIASVVISPIIGFLSDVLINFWKNYHNGLQDILYTVPCFLSLVAVTLGLAFSLLSTNIWPTMTFVAFSNGLIYTYENMSIVSSQGLHMLHMIWGI